MRENRFLWEWTGTSEDSLGRWWLTWISPFPCGAPPLGWQARGSCPEAGERIPALWAFRLTEVPWILFRDLCCSGEQVYEAAGCRRCGRRWEVQGLEMWSSRRRSLGGNGPALPGERSLWIFLRSRRCSPAWQASGCSGPQEELVYLVLGAFRILSMVCGALGAHVNWAEPRFSPVLTMDLGTESHRESVLVLGSGMLALLRRWQQCQRQSAPWSALYSGPLNLRLSRRLSHRYPMHMVRVQS